MLDFAEGCRYKRDMTTTTAPETFTTEHDGRTFELTAQPTPEHSARDLRARGWDGVAYFGVSEPRGRQRIAMHALFYRSAATGRFELVARV